MQEPHKPSNSSTAPAGRSGPPSARPPPSRPPPSRPPPSRPPPSRPPPSRPPPGLSSSPPPRLGPELLAGGTSGLLLLVYALGFAALIFSDKLATHLPGGLGAMLVSSVVLSTLVALRSSFKPAVAGPQDTTSVLLALMASTIAAGAAKPEHLLPTVIAAFALTALSTGALFTALGLLGLGKIVRFVPYPVVGGFLAGVGWLLVRGAFTVLSAIPLRLDTVSALFASGAPVRWIPGLAFGLAVTFTVRRLRHPVVLPALLFLGVVLFYAALGAGGYSVEDAQARGLLLGPFSSHTLWPPIAWSDLGHVQWSLLRDDLVAGIALMVLAGISMLLNSSGLELLTEQEIDLDRELRATGVANLLAGALGAPVGYLALGESTLGRALGARSRAPGVIAAGLCLVALLLGGRVFPYFPRAVLGGLLVFLGFTILLDALYAAWFRLPRGEYGLVVLILFVVVTVGFLEGVALGIVISSVLFALNYARINVVKHVISGAALRSKAARSATSEALLHHFGAQIYILKLQGYLFFGTAYNLLTLVQKRMNDGGAMPVRYVVLDFRHVDGIDSSAVLSFTKMRKLAEAQQVTLVFIDLPRGVRKQLERGGCIEPVAQSAAPAERTESSVVIFPDLDHGLEWCEDQIIDANADSRLSADALEREIAGMSRHRDLVAELSRYLERVDAPADFQLFAQGERSDDLYLIESGEVAAWLVVEGGRNKRLRTMGPGSVVGEAALYLGAPRSALVKTTRPSVLYRLSSTSLEQMTREAPRLAASFHRFVAQLLAERVVNTTTEAQMVFY
jgi:SulP family sulfate permease